MRFVIFAASALFIGWSTPGSGQDYLSAPFEDSRNSLPTTADSIRAWVTSSALGLKPQSARAKASGLPFGMNYSGQTTTLLVPIDAKHEWGIGVQFNLSAPRSIELAPPSALGLQPKRALGLTLQKSF
jgi:hypothetical protein